MTLEETRHNILTDETFVLGEIRKLQYCYGLKYEIRYGLHRGDHTYSESVAEHIYGMHVLADYFLPLEDETLNQRIVSQTITWHDMDELKTGDTISWKKTEEQIEAEKEAWQTVVPELPETLQAAVAKVVGDYEHQSSKEGKFVKAIDKSEPLFHLYNQAGKAWCRSVKLTRHDSERIKEPYLSDFPYITRFVTVLHNTMQEELYFAG